MARLDRVTDPLLDGPSRAASRAGLQHLDAFRRVLLQLSISKRPDPARLLNNGARPRTAGPVQYGVSR
jgi:hypothetical protein